MDVSDFLQHDIGRVILISIFGEIVHTLGKYSFIMFEANQLDKDGGMTVNHNFTNFEPARSNNQFFF